jgi:N,N'-diacetyllegionaminate synthase|tara:strand:+ start:1484 stop:2497 length:1014 start_codon:yes stop_codon:yes gene_type:complete
VKKKNKTLIIAEAGVNHNGNINLALKMVDIAARAKADFVKFQTYYTDDLVQKKVGLAKYQEQNLKGVSSQYKLLKKFELSISDHLKIIKRCKKKKIKFLSSPFDLKSIDLLKKLKLNLFKIPSGEITNIPYLRKIGALKKKIILSTGMSNTEEIKKAIKTIISSGTKKKNLTVLHCSSEYPAEKNNLNLLSIPLMKKKFNINVGYSDHSLGLQASFTAVALGAKVIEKHFTTNKKLSGPDQKASISPNQLANLVVGIRSIESTLGNNIKEPYSAELKNLKFIRKFIVAKKKIQKGEKFTDKNITTKRAIVGISASRWEWVIGKKAKKDFLYDENVKI